jgi:hypothetical protein
MTFLLEHGYAIGSVDKTFFTINHGTNFLLVQIYVDDIIFGASSHTLMSKFQKMMENEFQMSMMGELIFFLGIQVKQTKQDTFVHQVKYTKDLMKKFNMTELKPLSTPMSTTTSLGPAEDGEAVDQREYRSMIGSLLYLTTTQTRHSVRHVTVCILLDFPMLFTSNDSSADLQAFQTLTRVWDLVFCLFFA